MELQIPHGRSLKLKVIFFTWKFQIAEVGILYLRSKGRSYAKVFYKIGLYFLSEKNHLHAIIQKSPIFENVELQIPHGRKLQIPHGGLLEFNKLETKLKGRFR